MKKIVLSFLLAVSSISFGQTKDELDLCMVIQANSFTSNAEAENALDRILDVIGASKNFVLTPCDKISNAIATAYKGTRYILYDKQFMNLISKNTNDWSNLFIFAHEVGHHINGHSIDLLLYTNDVVDAPSLEKSRQQELEADEFAAFVLAKLGANLSQLNNVITLISDNSEDTFSTHPNRDKRLESVRVGYNKGYVKKETRVVINNSNRKNYELIEGYVKYSNWYRKFEKDIFEGSSWESIVEGNLIGDNGLFEYAPLLKIKKSKSNEISITLEFKNKINEIFKNINTRIIFPISTTEVIIGSNGEEIHKESDFTTNYKISNPVSIERVSYENKRVYDKKIDFLKKGSRFLIRIDYFFVGSYAPWELDKKEWQKNTEVKSAYFEYSLSGSSKALAD